MTVPLSEYPDPSEFPDGDDIDSTTIDDKNGYSAKDHNADSEGDE